MKTLVISGLVAAAVVIMVSYDDMGHHVRLTIPTIVSPEFKWTQVAPPGSGTHQHEWKPGTYPSAIKPIAAFNNDLWMIGQKRAWSSKDGIHWQAHDKEDWGERISVAQVFFKNKLWASGGMDYKTNRFLNEIWSSEDGKTWKLTVPNAEWSPRKGHTLIVFKSKLWLFGGETSVNEDKSPDKFINDIWSSDDGIGWVRVAAEAPWKVRGNPQVTVFKDELYLVGGQGQSDIWRSHDGKTWKQLTADCVWKDRYDYGLQAYDNFIWVFGGREHNPRNAYKDVWFSHDGVTWRLQTDQAPWTPRSGANSVVFNNKLWLYGGKHTGHDDSFSGDIWILESTHDQ